MKPVGKRRNKPQPAKGNGQQAAPVPTPEQAAPVPAPEQAADKPNGQTKQYSLSQQELAAYAMVALRADLAKEKATNARHLQEQAAALRQQWATEVYRRLSIPETARASIDPDAGTITVQAVPEPQPPVPPEPPQQENQAP